MSAIEVYGDPISGNCLKVRWTLDFIGLGYKWKSLDILDGRTHTDEFLAKNPFGQVPIVVLEDGEVLAQSNAIILALAEREASSLLPADFSLKSKVYQWLFWEQNSHEPYIAGRRFRKAYLGLSDEKIDEEWLPRGNAALGRMEDVLSNQDFLVGESLTLADVAIVAYTRVAGEGGFDLSQFPAVTAWVGRVEIGLGVSNGGGA